MTRASPTLEKNDRTADFWWLLLVIVDHQQTTGHTTACMDDAPGARQREEVVENSLCSQRWQGHMRALFYVGGTHTRAIFQCLGASEPDGEAVDVGHCHSLAKTLQK